jgi:hypothetical protein
MRGVREGAPHVLRSQLNASELQSFFWVIGTRANPRVLGIQLLGVASSPF